MNAGSAAENTPDSRNEFFQRIDQHQIRIRKSLVNIGGSRTHSHVDHRRRMEA
jgi:hypothetical protein